MAGMRRSGEQVVHDPDYPSIVLPRFRLSARPGASARVLRHATIRTQDSLPERHEDELDVGGDAKLGVALRKRRLKAAGQMIENIADCRQFGEIERRQARRKVAGGEALKTRADRPRRPQGVCERRVNQHAKPDKRAGHTATNKGLASLELELGSFDEGEFLIGMAVTPDGKHLYLANPISQKVSVIDTATNSVSTEVDVGGAPVNIAIFA
jgi:YVTN family beta-propeller protein